MTYPIIGTPYKDRRVILCEQRQELQADLQELMSRTYQRRCSLIPAVYELQRKSQLYSGKHSGRRNTHPKESFGNFCVNRIWGRTIVSSVSVIVLREIFWTYSAQGKSSRAKCQSNRVLAVKSKRRDIHVDQTSASNGTTYAPCPSASWKARSGRGWQRRNKSDNAPRLEILNVRSLNPCD